MFRRIRIFLLRETLNLAVLFRFTNTAKRLLGYAKDLTPEEKVNLIRPAINTACKYGRNKSLDLLLSSTGNLTPEEKAQFAQLAPDAIKSISSDIKFNISVDNSSTIAAGIGGAAAFQIALPTFNTGIAAYNAAYAAAAAATPELFSGLIPIAKGISTAAPLFTSAIGIVSLGAVAGGVGVAAAVGIYNSPLGSKNLNYGRKKCFELLLKKTKDLTPEQKVQIARESIKIAILQDNHEAFKSSLDLVKNVSDQDKINLLGNQLDSSINNEYKIDILNFFAESGIKSIGRKNLWEYAQENNLEPQTHELWKLTKDSYKNMDEVNNKLLANKDLKLNFFADIACSMTQNGKTIDSNTIPDTTKKEVLNDIIKLSFGEKDGYEHKIFQDMTSLDGIKPSEKIQAAVSILTMKPGERTALISMYQRLPLEATSNLLRSLGHGNLIKTLQHNVNFKSMLEDPSQKLDPTKKNPQTPLDIKAREKNQSFVQRLATCARAINTR